VATYLQAAFVCPTMTSSTCTIVLCPRIYSSNSGDTYRSMLARRAAWHGRCRARCDAHGVASNRTISSSTATMRPARCSSSASALPKRDNDLAVGVERDHDLLLRQRR
jgi:hypothetical protein